MFEETVWSLIPPLLAITLAIVTRQVFLALGLGIVSGAIMLEASFWPGMARSVELVVETLNDPSNAMVVLFTFVIGSLISSMESLGGIRGFVNWLEHSGWLVWLVGVLIFIESNITILVAGALARPLFDKFKISREKLAYLIDSTSAPICLVIPFNAWGAYIISILQTLGEPEPVSLFVRSILYNFYSLFAVFLALMTALFAFDLGPMKKAEARTRAGQLLYDADEFVHHGFVGSREPCDRHGHGCHQKRPGGRIGALVRAGRPGSALDYVGFPVHRGRKGSWGHPGRASEI